MRCRADGEETEELPLNALDRAEPLYAKLAGRRGALGGATTLDALPKEASAYLRFVEAKVGVQVLLVSAGATREETILDALPKEASAYLRFVEAKVGVQVLLVSAGATREETILVKDPFEAGR